jgi:hypothetical protein
MKIQFTVNGRVVSEREAKESPNVVYTHKGGMRDGITFDDETPIAELSEFDSGLLMEMAFSGINESYTDADEYNADNVRIGYRLIREEEGR